MGGNSFERLPPALAAATALTRLALDDNDELALSPADARLLAALPRLELLELGPASLVPQRVQAQLAAAEHLRISYGWGDTSSQGTSSGSSSDDEGMGSGSDEER